MQSNKTQDARVKMYLQQVYRTPNTNTMKAYQAMKASSFLNPQNSDQ